MIKQINKHFGGFNTKMVAAEVGVERGCSSEMLLKYFPDLFLHMIDCWSEGKDGGTKTDQHQHDDNLIETLGRVRPWRDRCRIYWMPSSVAWQDFGCDFDFVFLDANHSYREVSKDLVLWWRTVKPGGLLCGDDYGGRMEKHARRGWGVKRAVDEFAQNRGLTVNTAPMNFFWIIRDARD